jgi:hypothetical protein
MMISGIFVLGGGCGYDDGCYYYSSSYSSCGDCGGCGGCGYVYQGRNSSGPYHSGLRNQSISGGRGFNEVQG